jgi:hypothetical protein
MEALRKPAWRTSGMASVTTATGCVPRTSTHAGATVAPHTGVWMARCVRTTDAAHIAAVTSATSASAMRTRRRSPASRFRRALRPAAGARQAARRSAGDTRSPLPGPPTRTWWASWRRHHLAAHGVRMHQLRFQSARLLWHDTGRRGRERRCAMCCFFARTFQAAAHAPSQPLPYDTDPADDMRAPVAARSSHARRNDAARRKRAKRAGWDAACCDPRNFTAPQQTLPQSRC